MSTPEKKSRGGGRVAFLKHRESIRELIEAGHVARSIYDQLGGDEKLGISYSQFMRYVNKFITPGKSHDIQATPPPHPAPGVRTGITALAPTAPTSSDPLPRPPANGTGKPASTGPRPGAQPRIQHNSVASDKDDLIG
ncbi:TraK family protein [Stenotrophomonas sp. GD03993]|uniref:TraK family protein n=1 Tax=unclassified Stenotrophomonas TaxID=196198 RepID=UPI00244AE261|nr:MULTISPECIES: TraK family protein [unclassified Stenotrophomonas]MDH0187692.1 TraK family protein [Stenotrophomonas sp. GD04051]MDH0465284.1 TraK family protein [Stenotrophomonas sp. GD03993]MDH0877871.1 TraK family protein [Stenotrophomonas sp. GD03877]